MKKHIVFVIESLQLGGAEKSLVTLLQNLDYTIYAVDLITFHSGGFFHILLPSQVNHRVVSFPSLSLTDRFRYKKRRFLNKNNVHNAQLLWPIISKYLSVNAKSYDIAIAYNQGLSTYYAAEFLKAEVKYAWLNTDYKKAGYKISLDYPFYSNFNKIITVSPEAEASFKQALNEYGKTIEVDIIKDITDKKIVQKQAEEPLKANFDFSKINIVSVGRLVAPKGFHLAVEACKLLKENGYNINWYIIGEGVERQRLEELIQSKNLTNNFFLFGADTNPYPFMKACDIYVQTSLFEGLGLTVIEAAYLYKPIVSTDFPTVYNIIKNEETGLIAVMNASSIANKIEILINNKDLRTKFSANLKKNESRDKDKTLIKIEQLLNSGC